MKIVYTRKINKGEQTKEDDTEFQCDCGGKVEVVHEFGMSPCFVCQVCGKKEYIKYQTR